MPADEVFYDVAMQRLSEQMDRIDKLDTKIATVFGFSAGILPLFGALVGIFQNDSAGSTAYLYLTALLVYLFLLFTSGWAYMIADWRLDPAMNSLRDNSLENDNETMRLWVASECVRAIASNEPKLRTKATIVGVALVLLAVEVLVLSLSAAIAIL